MNKPVSQGMAKSFVFAMVYISVCIILKNWSGPDQIKAAILICMLMWLRI
jgi:hypothetical protein